MLTNDQTNQFSVNLYINIKLAKRLNTTIVTSKAKKTSKIGSQQTKYPIHPPNKQPNTVCIIILALSVLLLIALFSLHLLKPKIPIKRYITDKKN